LSVPGEEFEDTKGVIRIRNSKKDRQHNGKKGQRSTRRRRKKKKKKKKKNILFPIRAVSGMLHKKKSKRYIKLTREKKTATI
jgi:hypothetical protein